MLAVLSASPPVQPNPLCVDRPCSHCQHYIRAGDACEDYGTVPMLFCDPETNLMRLSELSFLECFSSRWLLRECASGTYYQPLKGCVDPTVQPFMQGLSVSGTDFDFIDILKYAVFYTGSGRVGDACQYNTDCLGVTNPIWPLTIFILYFRACTARRESVLVCQPTFCESITVTKRSIQISPGALTTCSVRQYGLERNVPWIVASERVDAQACVTFNFPQSSLIFLEETHVARETRDGWVCISLKDQGTGGTAPLYFVCPLPEGAGFKIALNDPAIGAFPVGCTVGSSATVEPVAGLNGGGKFYYSSLKKKTAYIMQTSGACMWPSDGEYIGDIYDCLHTSPHVSFFETLLVVDKI